MEALIDKIKSNKNVCLAFFIICTMMLYALDIFESGSFWGYIYRGVLLGLLLIYSLATINFKKFLQNKKIVSAVLLYVIFSFISLLLSCTKGITNINSGILVQSIGDVLVNCITIIIIFDIFDENKNAKNNLPSFIMLGIAIFAILFSLIKDFDEIKNLFINYDHSNYDITSFFLDKNSFGLCLFLGTLGTTTLVKKKSSLYIIPTFVFFLYSLLARAKSSAFVIMIVLVFEFLLIIYKYKHYKRSLDVYIVVSFIVFSLLLLILTLCKVSFFSKVYNVLFEKYGILYDAKIVMQDRIKNWSNILRKSSNPLVIIFGWGERFNKIILKSAIDNAFIYLFTTGGIIKLILYCYGTYLLIRNCKINICFIVMLLSIAICGFFQDYFILGFNYSSLGFLLMLSIQQTFKD